MGPVPEAHRRWPKRRRAVGGKATRKKPRWGGLAVKGGQAELIGGILFINR